MNVVVSGGAGFVGSHLCDSLIAEGHRVTVLDNLITGKWENVKHLEGSSSFQFILHDVTEPLPDLACDAIYHLASPASPVGYWAHPLETLMVNSVGTHNLLQLAEREGARFLLASTSEVYGDPVVHPQTEDYWGNVNPIGPRSCYDEGKRFAEALTVNYAQERGLDYRIVRIFNTYGPRNQPEDGRVIPNFLTEALSDTPLTINGDGRQTRSFCYVSDLVEGLMLTMFEEAARDQVINLGNPEEFTILDLAQRIKSLVGSASAVSHERPRPEEIVRRQPDISKAKKLLKWEPKVGLDEGLKLTVEWLQDRSLSSQLPTLHS